MLVGLGNITLACWLVSQTLALDIPRNLEILGNMEILEMSIDIKRAKSKKVLKIHINYSYRICLTVICFPSLICQVSRQLLILVDIIVVTTLVTQNSWCGEFFSILYNICQAPRHYFLMLTMLDTRRYYCPREVYQSTDFKHSFRDIY